MSGIGMQMHLSPRMDQRQILAPRMIQSMEILQLPIADLQAKIEKELQENPFLEQKEKHGETDEVPPDFNPDAPLKHDTSGDLEFSRLDELNRDWDNHFNEEHRVSRGAMDEEGDRKLDAMANMANRPQSLQDHLAEQIGELELDEATRRLAKHICSFIDRTGYLGTREKASEDDDRDAFRTVTLAEIAQSYDQLATDEEVEEALTDVVHKLEPAGVGARDLKECLLLQLNGDTPYRDVLRVLVRDHLEDIANNRIPIIQKATKFDIPTIQEAIEALHHLDPKPGLKFADVETRYVMPDVIVERTDDDDFNIRLTDEWVPKIRISKRTVDLIKNKDLDDKVREELRKKLQSADWLVKAVEQRRNTLLKVTRAIIEHQRAFLDIGMDHIQPLKMQQIADQVKVHVTTVSRAVDDKWVQTPRGVFPLKRFFGGGKENKQTGEDVAYEVMKQKLMELVSNEDKSTPLSDEELVTKLNDSGYPVARRTVTKYRKMLKIPSSRQRKDWSLGS
ncbi:rna sigma 54 : RNA polymerase sigma-54 factor OS=Singulisphaera acidiphila (strain ATCC BAA-1392 / DSM 18658 / VKM B-2454 / MOB10) GN=Sinac_1313 PE=4 SV=1: Sigma54_AID: Sigma54_CBD: Sigma54_DBD [Gemmataceae bacterium]|nr:rna sigma 54 : RNA polymerase sigma-54 factor OS=Singulisphaera acidiphila (strain ATCC BAA-1392 / DSM 18658 / VKM B-2454 / MOB10) GN=Sinac_1313 PE=4 SV=1: Sigma54_AID: Sigma54_CBD: Sigma54_DBD [Gemmataceae bacterium]VTT96662.1 rna sigma 54 : RNA polymerase sigma-54 factor OS=Singulisphaera acidiphila (strain ATCC BAA-1392 / DSM 18658 / VKM B-2454 / MOB10) GN=Sinac_1313 PE=4 SV=1: Sigma54_AID: Sigma54_CBD: Sigma54_DBD [Gemmataceae bacterium]